MKRITAHFSVNLTANVLCVGSNL